MRAILSVITLLLLAPAAAAGDCSGLLDYQPHKLHSRETIDLCQFQGKVTLIVNTASQCGYTPQFKGLEALYRRYRDQGLVVLGFPSDDFHQEFASEAKTASVCYINYGVSFPMLATSPVRGSDANPVFRQLNAEAGEPGWNFNKYLVGADGAVLEHFQAPVTPDDKRLTLAIEAALKQQPQGGAER